jgi:hypothetical protein
MLQGSLETLSFGEVLHLAARKRMSGSLRVRTSQVSAVLHLSEGRISGIDTMDAGRPDFRARVEDLVAQLLETRRGSFELRPTLRPTSSSESAIEAKAVLAGARRRLKEWHDVLSVVPGVDARPRLVAYLDGQEVTLSREQWRVLQAIDGNRNVRSLARLLGTGHQDIAKSLKVLVDAGAIEVDPSPASIGAGLPRVASPRQKSLGARVVITASNGVSRKSAVAGDTAGVDDEGLLDDAGDGGLPKPSSVGVAAFGDAAEALVAGPIRAG